MMRIRDSTRAMLNTEFEALRFAKQEALKPQVNTHFAFSIVIVLRNTSNSRLHVTFDDLYAAPNIFQC